MPRTVRTPGGDLVLGIDAGGTRTRAALAPARPRETPAPLLATGTSGPGNALSVPEETLAGHLGEAVAAAVPAPSRPRVRAVVAGFAGGSAHPGDPGRARASHALARALAALGIRPERSRVYGDVEIAFAAAPATPDRGLVLIAGTGAVAARIADRAVTATSDGNGWLLGDAGSGFWIGRRAVRAVLAAADERGAPTLLTAAVCAHYLGTDRPPADLRDRLVRAVHARPVLDLAGLGPAVADTAAHGDPAARAILTTAAERLTATLAPLAPAPGEPLVTTGGLLGPGGVLLPALRARLAPLGLALHPVRDGLPGATALARTLL
ncbi:BadF/BadG/BcrA/BcrD ATPase family protein [Streptomyces sp. NPDC047002]|uniref:N-acetylglucosamine kinase n=1 Tax=Streptomyces sp. NPDC047002 TaxID=3155475 RepID=UPI0034513E6E